MRKTAALTAATIASFLIACGSTPGKEDTVAPAAQGTGTAAAAAGGKTDAAPAGPAKFAVGAPGTLSLADGSAATVVVSTAKIQGKFIVAAVTITCTAGAVKYNEFDWTALAGDGTKLDQGFSIDVKNQLDSGDLGVGQKVTGNLVFDGTAAQLKGAQFQFSPGFKTLAYWEASK